MGKLLGSATAPQKEEDSIKDNNNNETALEQTDNSASKDNSPNNMQPLSASLVSSVNTAAETARLVLDQSTSSTLPNVQEDEMHIHWTRHDNTAPFSSPLPPPHSKSSGSINKLDISIQSELTEFTASEEATVDDVVSARVPGSSPPPLAFQNLPMSRYIPVSSHDDTSSDMGVMGGISPNRPFEVTNHYDAAAAISAALASSHLAQASCSSVGELQSVKSKVYKRDESFTDDSVEHVVLTPSNSYKCETDKKGGKAAAGATERRTLPSREEAEEEMLARRKSFHSMTDDSFTEYLTGNLKTCDGSLSQNNPGEKIGGDDLFGDFLDHAFKAKLQQTSSDDSAKSELPKIEENAPKKPNQIEGGDSISICSSNDSSNGRSNFENESNTSSYGSSDFSPITMSFGSSSDDGKQEQSNVTGILGTLANPPAGVAAEGDASYSAGTDEEDNSHDGGGDQGVTATGPRPLVDSTKLPKYLAPSRAPMKVERSPTARSASALPINQQYVSLFESFDRNLAQSVEGTADAERMFELSQKFLSSFVAVLGVMGDNKHKDARVHSSDADTGLTHYDWWSEDSKRALGYNLGVVAEEKSDDKEAASDEDQVRCFVVGVPIVVIRSMWTACFFDESIDEEEVEKTIDSIQDNLVNNLHYLAETEGLSMPCLCLTLPLYKEYAWYTLLCRSEDARSIEETVASWHSKFATFLREALLVAEKDDDECELNRRIICRFRTCSSSHQAYYDHNHSIGSSHICCICSPTARSLWNTRRRTRWRIHT